MSWDPSSFVSSKLFRMTVGYDSAFQNPHISDSESSRINVYKYICSGVTTLFDLSYMFDGKL